MIKSPLAQAFGMALAGCRSKLNLTAEDVAQAIETTSTYYKAVESGAHNLHVSKAFLLCKAFTANGKDSVLNLPSVLHLLGFISMLELACNRSYPKNQKEFAEIYYLNFIEFTLGQVDVRMKYIRERFESAGIFELLEESTSKEIRQLIAKLKLDVEVFTFIDRPRGKAETTNTNLYDYFANEFFENFPSFYVGHLLDVKQSLKRLPIKYDYRSSWLWEKDNVNKIVKVFGICTSKEFLAEGLSKRKYDYVYFNGTQFKEMKFIVLDTDTAARDIKTQLEDELVNCLKQQIQTLQQKKNAEKSDQYDAEINFLNYRINNRKAEQYKVNFKVSNDRLFNIENLLSKPTQKVKFNTYWIFEIEGGYYLGVKAFIPHGSWRFQDAEYLSFGEAKRLVQTFDNYWSKIEEYSE